MRRCRPSSIGARALYVALLLIPPLLWFGTVYLGSLFTLLAQSIYSIDEFTAKVVYEPTLATYKQVVTQPANVDIILRTLSMAVAVTIACAADRVADRQLHGSLRVAARPRAVLRRRDAADVDELSREGLCVAADPREAGHPQLAARYGRARRCARRGAADSRHRRSVAVGVVPRHVHRVRLHVAAVHDPAARGRAGESAGVVAAGVGGSRRAARRRRSAP